MDFSLAATWGIGTTCMVVCGYIFKDIYTHIYKDIYIHVYIYDICICIHIFIYVNFVLHINIYMLYV